jgi:hypothetical protein
MNEDRDRVLYLKGKGIPYHLVYHLLEGSSKPLHPLSGQSKKFYDANLLWRNVSDDSEIKEINTLELEAGDLSSSIRDLRVMVDFCCIWRYDYPKNLIKTCRAIGQMKSLSARCHYQIGIERGEELNAYATALKSWLEETQTCTNDSERKIIMEVFRILGTRNHLKKLLVERTYLNLINRYFDCSFFGYDSSETNVPLSPFAPALQQNRLNCQRRIYELDSTIIREMGGAGYNFLGEVGGVEPPCHFKFIRRLLILIGSIGTLKWRGYVPSIEPRMKGRRELTRICLTALESFFRGENIPPGLPLDKGQKELFEKIRDLLGKSDTLKNWLVFSLYKNIKNQTLYQAYTMKRWVEFVRIKDKYISTLTTSNSPF